MRVQVGEIRNDKNAYEIIFHKKHRVYYNMISYRFTGVK